MTFIFLKKILKTNPNFKEQVTSINNSIQTVKIGAQQWATKNLDVFAYRNGDIIPEVKDPDEWSKLTTGAWCYYNNDDSKGVVYGKLYNWFAVNDPRGLAPVGYHIATDLEWKLLTNYLGGKNTAGRQLKSKNFWKKSFKVGIDSRGFKAMPGGYAYSEGGV